MYIKNSSTEQVLMNMILGKTNYNVFYSVYRANKILPLDSTIFFAFL